MKTIHYIAAIAGCLLLAGCEASHQFAGAGAALIYGAVEYATTQGEMSKEVGDAITTGITQMDESQRNLEKAQAGTLTTGEAQAWGGGLAASVIAALRVWRGKPSKGLSKSVQNIAEKAKG